MIDSERERLRIALITGISINQMVSQLHGKAYAKLVEAHLDKLDTNLPASIAVAVATCTPEEKEASEWIIDQFNSQASEASFWSSDAGEILTSVSCELNDALLPAPAEEAGVFNLFQLITMRFAWMAHEQPAVREMIMAAPAHPETAPESTSARAKVHGIITRMIGVAVRDHDAGRITDVHFRSILQAAIDNGDILLEANQPYVEAVVCPLLDAGVLRPSRHTLRFEQQVNAAPRDRATESRATTPSSGQSMIVGILQWVAVAPASAAAALAARFLFILVHNITAARYIEPDSWINRVFVEYMGGVVLGACGVYTAAYVAPTHKKPVAGVAATLLLLLAGFFLFPAVSFRDYWSVLSLLCVGLGAGTVAYATITDQFTSLHGGDA